MGYYATMYAETFLSTLSPDEMQKAWEKFLSKQEEMNKLFLEMYQISYVDRFDDCYEYEIEMDSYCEKHYACEKLIEFISQVISYDTCCIEFTGEDNEQWGYLVTEGEVKEIDIKNL